jgi:CO/xanthine dehydrogenase Mo-binding subunit
MNETRWVGQTVGRVDGVEKVTGCARYTADLKFPRLLHALVLRSPHPHARILAVRLERAARVSGVRAVASGRDFPFHTGIYLKDQTVFATDRVRYVGDPVAAVAAESEEAALAAATLVEIDYEPLPPVFDVLAGIAPDAPLIHPDLGNYECVPWITPKPGTNICNHLKVRKGDYATALASCRRVFDNTFEVPQVQHVPIEPHVSVACVDLAGKVMVHTSAQSPFTVRHLLCACFSLSHGDVQVTVPAVGGGFGGKAGINLEPIAVALAMKARGRWVRVMVDRAEEFYATVVRQGLTARLVTGVDDEGRVQAQKMHYLWSCGGYGGYGVNVVRAAGYTCGGAYEFPNVEGDSIGVYTNRPVGSAYRGFGMQEIHWALEQQMDIVARGIGMHPVDFRLLNCLGPGKATVTGQVLDEHAGRVDLCIRRVDDVLDMRGSGMTARRRHDALDPQVSEVRDLRNGEAVDPRSLEALMPRPAEARSFRGKGMACAVKAPAMPNDAASSVVMKFAEDATLEIIISGIDYGQGLKTVAAQFAAEAMDLPMESVRVRGNPDTDLSPYDWQTVASRQTWATGNAILKAAAELKRQLFAVAAQILEAPEAEMECRQGAVVHAPSGRGLPLARLVMGYQFPDGHAIGGPVATTTSFLPEGLLFLDPETSQSAKPVAKWTFGAQAVEVTVDSETGQYTVDRVAACYDVGRVINPGLIRGQTYGGIVQGLGTGMMEELRLDRATGRIANASLMDYKIPSSEDVPADMVVSYIETPQSDGPMGARGIGEHTMIPTPAAIANAIFDACGVRIHEMPITAEKVLAALRAKDARG